MIKVCKISRLLLLVATLTMSMIAQACPQLSCIKPKRHVILIGLDGARRDAFNLAIKQLTQNNLDTAFTDLIKNGAIDNHFYAGGHLNDNTRQLTFSEPGWVTILTGAWAEHTHIRINGDIKRNKYNHNYPTIYNYIKHFIPNAITASFTDWKPLFIFADYRYYGDDAADINQFFYYDNPHDLQIADHKMTDNVVSEILSANAPTFIYIHYINPDEAGHAYGYSPNVTQYMDAIKQEANNINKLIEALHQSEKRGDAWLTIITTDHGGHENIHGTESPDDRNMIAVFNANDTLFSGGFHIPLKRGQVAFVPTILDYLGVRQCIDTLDGDKL